MKIRRKERVSNHSNECHYLTRWTFETSLFSIRIHNWLKSDDQRHAHNHPWNFISLVLAGEYIDDGERGRERRKRFSIKKYPYSWTHKVVVEKPCWTLLLTGPVKNKWGFFTENKTFLSKRKYFKKFGHHQCD